MDKGKLLDDAGHGDRARIELMNYLSSYGHDIENFSDKVRDFFAASQDHHDRLAIRDAIAKCFNLDVREPGQRDKLWKLIVKFRNYDRRFATGWKTGQRDMPLSEILVAVRQMVISRADLKTPSIGGLMPPLQTAIARSLVYIRVFPPKPEINRSDLPDANNMPDCLERCWRDLRRHPHYRNSKPPNLNQHALDTVADAYRTELWIEPHEIGSLKRAIEHSPSDPDLIFWFWPFVVLKYATKEKIASRNHNVTNPFSNIWDPNQVGFSELWA